MLFKALRRRKRTVGSKAGPRRVLFITTSLPVGGAETLLASLVRGFDSDRVVPEICCLKQPGPLGEILAREFPVHHGLLRHKYDVGVVRRLARLMRRRRVDAVVTVGAGDKMFWGRLAARVARVPWIVSALHSTGWPDGIGRMNRWLTPITDRFIAVADSHARYLIEHERLPADRVVVIPNGVDTGRFRSDPQSRSSVRAELGIPPDTPLCGIVAALRPEKNHLLFLRAAAMVLHLVPDSHFVIVGDGDQRDKLQAAVAETSLQKSVHLLGTRNDIPRLVAALDVLALTSQIEANPVSILEAMACGVPVVATSVGSISEVVADGVTGFLAPAGDAVAVAAHIRDLFEHPERAHTMGAAGRAVVEQRWTVDHMIAGYERVASFARMNRMAQRPRKRRGARRGFDAAAQLETALDHHRGGRWAEAERIYLQIHESEPPRADVTHLLGLVAYQLGKHQTAIRMLKWAVELNPENANALTDLGNLLQEQGDLDGAEQAVRRAVSLDPNHIIALTNLGIIHKNQGRLAEALDLQQRAVAVDPQDSQAHYNLAITLRHSGKLDAAVEAIQHAIELSPGDADARQALCGMLREAGRHDELPAAFDDWLNCDPTNPIARHMRAAAAGDEVPARASDEYVRALFDEFSSHFDDDLTQLGYDVPRMIGQIANTVRQTAAEPLDVLDAGCGTGLCGVQLRELAGRLDGVDLSPLMLEKAAGRSVYDRLEAAELTCYMNRHPAQYDLVVAGDTFNYFGDLAPLLSAVAATLKPNGTLVFSLETNEEPQEGGSYTLHHHGRYSHAQSYAESSLAAAGFCRHVITPIVVRQQADEDVRGALFTSRMCREA